MNIHDLVAIDIHTHAETSTRILPDEAEKEALEARGLSAEDMCVPVEVLSAAEIGKLMEEQDVLLSF